MYGRGVFGRVPYGRSTADESVAPLFEQLFANPDLPRHLLVIAEPGDAVTGETVALRYKDTPIHLPPPAPKFRRRVIKGLSYRSSVLAGEIASGGGSVPSVGAIEIEHSDAKGDNDASNDPWRRWHELVFDNRPVRVLMGSDGFTLEQFDPVLIGKTRGFTFPNEHRFSLIFQDPSLDLQKPIQPHKYGGTGGLDGGDDLLDVPIPLCWGRPKNVKCVRVNTALHVYQWHDGPSLGIDASVGLAGGAFDRSSAFIYDGDVADVLAWTPVAGHFVTDLAKSVLRLGSAPDGLVTCDPICSGSTMAEIVELILRNQAGQDDAQLDLPAFAAMNLALPAPMGLYVTDGNTSTLQVVTRFIVPQLGGWFYTRLGEFSIGRLAIKPTADHVIKRTRIKSISSLEPELPFWRREVGYARDWGFPESANDVASGAADARKDFVSREYRLASAESLPIRDTIRLGSRLGRSDTYFTEQADAEAEAIRQLDLLSANRRRLRIVVDRWQYQIKPFETVEIEYDRYGLDAGLRMAVLGVGEDSGTRLTELVVWG